MNVYFPPAHPVTFLTKLFLDLAPLLSNSTVVIGGDYNLILNPLIDRFPHSKMVPSPHANALHALCAEFGLVDVWRRAHPSDKQYTRPLTNDILELIIFSYHILTSIQFYHVKFPVLLSLTMLE